MFQRNRLELWTNVPLANGENRTLTIGAPASGVTVADVREYNWLSIRAIASHNMTLLVDETSDPTGAAWDTLINLAIAAGTFINNYSLPAAMNNHPYLAITSPYMRVRINNTAGVNHTYIRLYMKWWR